MTALARFIEAAARRDPTTFAELVLRDEATGTPVRLSPAHRRMHELWTAGDRSVVLSFAEGGKTTMLAARVAWELGSNSALRVSFVSGTLSQAERVVRAVGRLIESPTVLRVFPSLRMAAQRDGGFTVAGRPTSAKDPSVSPSGLGLGSVLGARYDLVIGDDLLDLESTRTPQGRESAWSAFVSVHLSRLAPGGRVWLAGTSWHPDDVLHRAARLPGWRSERFPVLDPTGVPSWPERWPLERVQARRLELGPLAFARVMMCEPASVESLVFSAEHVARALMNGASANTEHFASIGGRFVLGVDVAFSTGPGADESALVLVRVRDDLSREVVEVWAGRWAFDELCARVVDTCRRYQATAYVESNGGGGFVVEQVKRAVPARGLHTSAANKAARVEWLAAELASGRWSIRQPGGVLAPGARRLSDELLTYSSDSHTGDRLAALLVAVEGVRGQEQRRAGRVLPLDTLTR